MDRNENSDNWGAKPPCHAAARMVASLRGLVIYGIEKRTGSVVIQRSLGLAFPSPQKLCFHVPKLIVR